jgi:hypothetical protein
MGNITNKDAEIAVQVLRSIYNTQGHYIFRACADELCGIFDIKNSERGMAFRIRMAIVQRVVCRYFVVSMDTLRSHDRRAKYTECRQVFVYLARKLTLQSTPQVGKVINRDHSTVIHAEHKMKERFLKDAEFRKTILYLENLIIHEAEKELGVITKSKDFDPLKDLEQLNEQEKPKCQKPKKPNFDPPAWRPPLIKP